MGDPEVGERNPRESFHPPAPRTRLPAQVRAAGCAPDRTMPVSPPLPCRGITTNPAFMMVHIDDHAVHRGHGVFDTLPMCNGHLYDLDHHLDRLADGCERVRVALPLSREEIRRVVLHTAAASKSMDGTVRLWVSAGRGDFSVSPRDCARACLYCAVVPGKPRGVDAEAGWRVVTSGLRQAPMNTVKSTNYLQNALAQMEAEDAGADTAVFTDAAGFVTEAPIMNLAIVTDAGELVFPPFDTTLPGTGARRLSELVRREVDERAFHALEGLSGVAERQFTVEEARAAAEVMLVGSTTGVIPVTAWDGAPIGDGTGGKITVALGALLRQDMDTPGDLHTEVPYGYLTAMRGL